MNYVLNNAESVTSLYLGLQWKPRDVIALVQILTYNINQMIPTIYIHYLLRVTWVFVYLNYMKTLL